ncbi:MAG: EamA family transporter [Candidatus Heimdallarchaeota archaeon]|nr:MAG: EamA family transporter [Candidatus Heimdallarchaeota archaeon]
MKNNFRKNSIITYFCDNMKHFQPKTQCQISLIIATVAVSWASIFITILLNPPHNIPAVVIAFWRLFLSVLFLLPFISRKDVRIQFKPFIDKSYLGIFALSGLFLSLHFLSWISSLDPIFGLSVAVSVLIVNSSPIWVVVISFALLREKITFYQLIGLILGFGGLLLISLASDSQQSSIILPEGILLASFGAIMVACYFIIGKRMRAHHTVPNIPYVFFVNSFCSLFLFIFAVILGENILTFTLNDMVLFIALAIGPSLLGHAMYTYAMKHISAQTVSLAVIGETVGASILAWIIFLQVLPPITLIGGFFILFGIYLDIKYDISSSSTKD